MKRKSSCAIRRTISERFAFQVMSIRRLSLVVLIVLTVSSAFAVDTVLHSFTPYLNGANPEANVCLGPGGMYYGTTISGGPSGAGVVWRIDHAGHEAILHAFTGGADGGAPYAPVLCDSAGNIYGTTLSGGASGAGTVFRIDGAGHETVLYSFTGGADGGSPYYGLVQDSAGNLYGVGDAGGAYGGGVVFKLERKGYESVLYNFTGGSDGAFPNDIIRDSAGNIYGTTGYGGADGWGTVFKLDSEGNFTVLYTFTGGADGGGPYAGVVRDLAGNLYGAAPSGGSSGAGVVYKVDPLGNETVLYNFTGGADGNFPYADVTRNSAGNLFGTTASGGANGRGVVFKVDSTGHETVLYSFTGGADGAYPYSGVVMDSAGNLYGNTSSGGRSGIGALFMLSPAGRETVLYGFPATDGSNPQAGIVEDSAGNLYGTTSGGGTSNVGTVYKLNAAGAETILHSFTGGADGANPYAGVTLDSSGNVYGTTNNGGAGAGVVYKLDTTGHEAVLYTFTGGADGGVPNGGLIFDSAGNLYGTTEYGGSANAGVVYKLDTMGHQTVLHTFTGGADGANPTAGVIADAAGNLYGTTYGGGAFAWGIVYKLDPAGHETILYTFTGGNDGGQPYAGVILDSAGNLYGTTVNGYPTYPPGYFLCGVVYKLDPFGNQTVLHRFGVQDFDGWYPLSGVIFDSAGNLYGTTQYGGATAGGGDSGGAGAVYRLDPAGNETLYSFYFDGGGYFPAAGVFDSAGNLYGTTTSGGSAGAGVVYQVSAGSGAPIQQQAQAQHTLPDLSKVPPKRPWPWDSPTQLPGAKRGCPDRLTHGADLPCRL